MHGAQPSRLQIPDWLVEVFSFTTVSCFEFASDTGAQRICPQNATNLTLQEP